MLMSYFQAFTPQNPKNWGKELQRERSAAKESISHSIHPLKLQEDARTFSMSVSSGVENYFCRCLFS